MDTDERILEAWKTTVEVQKHFNELEMRVRGVAVTVLAAFLAATGFTLKEKLHIEILGRDLSLTTFILVAAAICWMVFYVMDRHWYHRLLRGAVNHGRFIEDTHKATYPELGLTNAIGDASPFVLGGKTIGSDQKIGFFYKTIFCLLLAAALVAFFDEPQKAPSAPVSSNSVVAQPALKITTKEEGISAEKSLRKPAELKSP